MSSKLSWHTMGNPTDALEDIEHAGVKVVKVYEWDSETDIDLLRSRVPLVVYRAYTEGSYDSITPHEYVASLPSKLMGKGLVWEGINEPVITGVAQAQQLNAWFVLFADLMHQRGERVAAFSFSTGNPPLELVIYLTEAAGASDYIAMHEYYHPQGSPYDQIGRYQQFLAVLPQPARRQVLITESGFDAGGGAEDGWQGKLSEEEYLAVLQQIDLRYMYDNWLVGATVFQFGGGGMWEQFDIRPISDALAEYIAWQGGGALPDSPSAQPPPVENPPLRLVKAALGTAMAAQPWMAVNNEAALWKYAQAHSLEDQQTDELPFTFEGEEYLVQVFNRGIAYVKVGDWGNITHVSK